MENGEIDMKEPTEEQVLDVLTKARDIMMDKRFWTAGRFCRVSGGGVVGVCGLGAIALAMPRDKPLTCYMENSPEVQSYSRYLALDSGGLSIPVINDRIGRNAIIVVFDRGISRLEKQLEVKPTEVGLVGRIAHVTEAPQATK